MADEMLGNDTLSEILNYCGLTGSVFCQANLSSPWGVSIPPGPMAHFHYMERGSCWLRLEGRETSQKISQGEIVILPHGNGHLLTHEPHSTGIPISEALSQGKVRNSCTLLGCDNIKSDNQMICGAFRFQESRQDLILSQLPEVMILYVSDLHTKTLIESVVKFVLRESLEDKPGSQIVLSRMAEILFVHILRSWLSTQEESLQTGWIHGLNDPQLVHALRVIHSRPHENWTVETLAEVSRMSRSPFAEKFKRVLGEGPLTYLTKWRMNLAAGLLERGNPTVYEVASKVGYESETSFSKAFKRHKGCPPAQWKLKVNLSK